MIISIYFREAYVGLKSGRPVARIDFLRGADTPKKWSFEPHSSLQILWLKGKSGHCGRQGVMGRTPTPLATGLIKIATFVTRPWLVQW